MYAFLDYLFVVCHASLVVFNLTGWALRSTRRLHLLTISLTLLSWFGLGVFVGWGYCPCTDWHWHVKRKLGEVDLPVSYVKYYADKLTGLDWAPIVVNAATAAAALAAFAASCWLNWRDWRVHRRP